MAGNAEGKELKKGRKASERATSEGTNERGDDLGFQSGNR
jgi:hypothetical protein